jgi:DNA-binding CsgD family transcriptional regulator
VRVDASQQGVVPVKNSLEEAIAKRRALIEACERSLSAAAERQRNAFGGSGWGGASSRPEPGSILRLIETKQRHEAALRELESLQTRRAPDDNPSSARKRSSETPDPPARKPKLPAKKKRDLSQYIDACHNLTSLQRECFSLRLEYGMIFQQIADLLDINKGTVYTHVQAATRKIEYSRSADRRQATRARDGAE